MSSSLYWEPIVEEKNNRGGWKLPLKGIIAKRYLDHDGSLGSGRAELTFEKDGQFIEGLVAAGVEDADELLAVLQKYEAIYIWTEC